MLAQLQMIAAEGPNGRFIPSDPKEMWWAIAAFAIIAFFIVTKGLPLINGMLDKGQEAAVADATAAEKAMAESQAKIAAATAELGDANAESQRIMAEAQETAKQLQVDSAARTQQLVDDMWAKAQSDVASMRVQASADIQAEVAAQAVGAAEQVVHSSLDASGQADLIENYISSLGVS
jgi:ATP synthase F0 subunit b